MACCYCHLSSQYAFLISNILSLFPINWRYLSNTHSIFIFYEVSLLEVNCHLPTGNTVLLDSGIGLDALNEPSNHASGNDGNIAAAAHRFQKGVRLYLLISQFSTPAKTPYSFRCSCHVPAHTVCPCSQIGHRRPGLFSYSLAKQPNQDRIPPRSALRALRTICHGGSFCGRTTHKGI